MYAHEYFNREIYSRSLTEREKTLTKGDFKAQLLYLNMEPIGLIGYSKLTIIWLRCLNSIIRKKENKLPINNITKKPMESILEILSSHCWKQSKVEEESSSRVENSTNKLNRLCTWFRSLFHPLAWLTTKEQIVRLWKYLHHILS